MIAAQRNFLVALAAGFFADRPKQTVSAWCCEHLRFNEPNNSGPFSLSGREYIREPLDAWADLTISDMVGVFGSQSGKTGMIMGGAAWTIVNNPSRIFWVMPTRDTVTGFSKERWVPMLLASPSISSLIPSGAHRHKFTTRSQQLGGSIVSLVWSNSPAALSSVPAPVLILDEVDKFNTGTKREADAVNLAEQRTKAFACPKRIKSSTPSMVEGLIWQEFLKTDQRRRFMPCPHCAKPVVLAWSKSYTTFKLSGCEAFATWDKEAKRKDGSWDLDRVEQSARFECPHCGGHIKDGHKSRMDRAGEWKPTTIAARGYRGWHLSSLYASSPETSVGRLARKFLMAKNSLNGLQGFINGDLAEPYQSQDTMQERIELVTASAEIKADQQKLMTVDCQEGSPHFWFAIRNWSATETIGIQAGAADTWEELRSIQTAQKIPDVGVIVDSGFGARSDADVYVNCARFADWFTQANGRRLAMGWMPAKGMPGRKRWHHKKTGNSLPWFLGTVDPFTGSAHAGDCSMNLLEFSGDFFKDILATLRSGKQTPKWSISDELNRTIGEEYWRHMDAEVKTGVFNRLSGTTRYEWRARSKSWPNHLLDCEVMQLVGACFFGILQLETLAEKKDGR